MLSEQAWHQALFLKGGNRFVMNGLAEGLSLAEQIAVMVE